MVKFLLWCSTYLFLGVRQDIILAIQFQHGYAVGLEVLVLTWRLHLSTPASAPGQSDVDKSLLGC